jgi:hypothetical protein
VRQEFAFAFWDILPNPFAARPMITEPKNPMSGSKNQRPCPALGGSIAPSDCGAQRGSRLNCPATCEFYPFGQANLSLFLKVDTAWEEKAIAYAIEHRGRAEFERLVRQVAFPTGNELVRMHSGLINATHLALFFATEPSGKTLAECWEAEGWAGLNNDERVMMVHRRQSLPTVVEVQRKLEANSFEAVDLFAPDRPRFAVYDRAATRTVVRFSRVFSWLTHYPKMSRLMTGAVEIPQEVWPIWREAIDHRFQASAAGRPSYGLKQFLAENLAESFLLIHEAAHAYQERALQSLDLHQCVASYALSGSVESVMAVLESKPEFQAQQPPEHDVFPRPRAFYLWLRRGESAAPAPELSAELAAPRGDDPEDVSILAQLRVYDKELVLEVFSKARYAFARRMLDHYLGALVAFQQESVADLSKLVRERQERERAFSEVEQRLPVSQHAESPGASVQGTRAVPGASEPREVEGAAAGGARFSPELRQRLASQQLENNYRRFLREPRPELGGLAPVAAARDPSGRGRLLELMKSHINRLERRSREEGVRLSIDWVLEELGLAELRAESG